MTKKLIRLEEFQILPIRKQLDNLHKDGVHVGKRIVDGKTAILYQIGGFYAEVYYHSYRKEVEKIILSSDVFIVKPYLSQVSVKELDKGKKD